MPPGLLLVLSAPSGAGKTTLARRLLEDLPQAHFSVSVTTRDPRGREADGVDYEFVDVETFQRRIEENAFVEWAEVHGNFYGSPQFSVEHARRTGGVTLFDIDVQGGQSIKRKNPDAVTVFILPPSMEELERRLRARGTDADATIRRRLLGARSEMERGVSTFDYVVINDDFEQALQQLHSIVIAERCRHERVKVEWLAGDRLDPRRENAGERS